MAKGQKRSNRETRKPKAAKPKPAASPNQQIGVLKSTNVTRSK